MEPKTGKRIVSKGEYVKLQGKRLWLYLCSLLTGISIVLLCCNICFLHYFSSGWCAFLILGIACMVWCGKIKTAQQWYQEAQKVPAVTPLTRANTTNLTAPDSLVRASSEPMQAQEAVLLRAAAQGAETPPEQLVRAVGVED